MISESPLHEDHAGANAACCCCRTKDGSKRPRTDSGSSASSSNPRGAQDNVEIEAEDTQVAASSTGKNIRGAAARNHRNKELREREEKQQKDRLDAASKRKGRAEKRRGDGKTPDHQSHLY